jgi:hypothetical protein
MDSQVPLHYKPLYSINAGPGESQTAPVPTHYTVKPYRKYGGKVPGIINPCLRWKQVVSFMLQPDVPLEPVRLHRVQRDLDAMTKIPALTQNQISVVLTLY